MVKGSVMDVNDEHPMKVPSLMVFMVEGSVMDVNDEHPQKTL